MIEPRSRHVVLDGRRFHYLEWGRADDPAVVILHGHSGHAWQAHHPAQVLATRRRVVAPDQRGHGDSDRGDVYGAKPMAADLLALLDALEIERCALVGHSLGGMVASGFVALHPERVERLVLGDIGPEVAPAGVERLQRQMRAPDGFADVDEAYASQLAANPTADPATLRFRVEHNLVSLPDGTLTWKHDRALRDGTARYDNFGLDEQWAIWAAIEVPVLILRGELSDLLSVDIAERMLAANPRATLVTLAGAGHSIATDAPDQVAAALDDFLR